MEASATTTRAVSGPSGWFEFQDVGPQVEVRVEAPGFVALGSLEGDLLGSVLLDGLQLDMAPARAAPGRVVDQEGIGVPDVRVHAVFLDAPPAPAGSGLHMTPAKSETVVTDASGGFVLADLCDGRWTLRLEAPDGRVARASIRLPDALSDNDELLVRLADTAWLRVRVTLPDTVPAGAPASGDVSPAATVIAFPGKPLRPVMQGVAFEGPIWPDLPGWIVASAPGCAAAFRPTSPVGAGETAELNVALVAAQPVTGRVVDGTGSPIANAAVRAVGEECVPPVGAQLADPSATWERAARCDVVHTDADGRFVHPQLGSRAYQFIATAPWDDRLECRVRWNPSDADPLLVIDRDSPSRARLTGAVRDAVTGAPVPVFLVIPYDREGGWAEHGDRFESSDGRFRIDNLRSGSMRIEVLAGGYVRWSKTRTLDAGENSLQVELTPAAVLELSVVNQLGASLPGVVVRALEPKGDVLMSEGRGFASRERRTDHGGVVRLSGLPARLVEIELSRELLASPFAFPQHATQRTPIDLSDPRAWTHTLVLPTPPPPPVQMVEVRLALPDGADVPLPVLLSVAAADGTLLGTGRLEPHEHGVRLSSSWRKAVRDQPLVLIPLSDRPLTLTCVGPRGSTAQLQLTPGATPPTVTLELR